MNAYIKAMMNAGMDPVMLAAAAGAVREGPAAAVMGAVRGFADDADDADDERSHLATMQPFEPL